MFKMPELSEEDKEHIRTREALEYAKEQERNEQRRRERCVELACGLEETRPENLVATCEQIYDYVYGSKE